MRTGLNVALSEMGRVNITSFKDSVNNCTAKWQKVLSLLLQNVQKLSLWKKNTVINVKRKYVTDFIFQGNV